MSKRLFSRTLARIWKYGYNDLKSLNQTRQYSTFFQAAENQITVGYFESNLSQKLPREIKRKPTFEILKSFQMKISLYLK